MEHWKQLEIFSEWKQYFCKKKKKKGETQNSEYGEYDMKLVQCKFTLCLIYIEAFIIQVILAPQCVFVF